MLDDVAIVAAHFKLKPAELNACLLSAYLHPFRAQRCYRAIAASLAPQNPAADAAKPGLACPALASPSSTDLTHASIAEAVDRWRGQRVVIHPDYAIFPLRYSVGWRVGGAKT